MTDTTASTFIATADRPPPAIRIGDIFGHSFKIFAARGVTYSAILMIAHVPMLAIKAHGEWSTTISGGLNGFDFSVPVLASLLAFAILALANGIVCLSVFQFIGGRPSSIGQAIGATLRQSPALIALFLLSLIYTILAGLLLIIPGIIVICVYAVALPVCVVERIGPIKAMSRSAFLTKGNRWRILGFTMLLFLVPLLSQLVTILAKQAGGAVFSAAASLPIEGVGGGFTAVAVAVLYARLRVAREGGDFAQIAAVFD
jgi:uncharacterized membrane protein